MHDGITLEKAGVPAAVICTEPFVVTAHALAELMGMANYPIAVVPHPIGSLPLPELEARARLAAQQVRSLLLEDY